MMNVRVEVLNDCKYKMGVDVVNTVTYKNIKGFEVKIIDDDKLWEYGIEDIDADEYKEYLFITLEDNSLATFRNSHVDMFREI